MGLNILLWLMSYFFLILSLVSKIVPWRAFQMFWYHTSPTLSLTLQLKPWKYCSPSSTISFGCSCVVQVRGVTRPVGFDAPVTADTTLCSAGYKNATLNIFPNIPDRFWSPEQAVLGAHQLVHYIWLSCSQGLMEYGQTSKKKMAAASLNPCLPSGWWGCQLKPISCAYIKCSPLMKLWNELLPIRHKLSSRFWMCGVNRFHWHETTPKFSAIPNFVQAGWSFSSASSPHPLAAPCWVLLLRNIHGSESWLQIFSFTWICPFWSCLIPFHVPFLQRMCRMILL